MPTQTPRTMAKTASPARNHGCKVGPKKPLKAKEIWRIRFERSHRGSVRDLALFDLAIDSKLRG